MLLLTFQPEPRPYSTLPIMYQPFPPYPGFVAQATQAVPGMHMRYPPPIVPIQNHIAPTVPPRAPQIEQQKVLLLGNVSTY